MKKWNVYGSVSKWGILAVLLLVLCLVPISAHAADDAIPIDEENFPDAAFREMLSGSQYDSNGDGSLSLEERQKVTSLYLTDMGISDATGIRNFPNLESVFWNNTDLTEIDLSGLPSVTRIQVYKNAELTSLDVSDCPMLDRLECNRNALSRLDCSDSNAITYLSCENNQLTELDVSGLAKLYNLECENNQLTSLDLSNLENLEYVRCGTNQLTSLNVSGAGALKDLDCFDNQLTELDVTSCPSLTELVVYNNKLNSLDVRNNVFLETLWCNKNQLKELDVSNAAQLSVLIVSDNQLSALDLSKNPLLTQLTCDGNQIAALSVTGNPSLTILSCSNNQIASINLSNNYNLDELMIHGNKLTQLDISKCPTLSGYVKALVSANSFIDVSDGIRRYSGEKSGIKMVLLTLDASATLIYDGGTIQGETSQGTSAEKQPNSISAKDITRNFSLKAQSFNIGATALGGAKLSYKSGNSGKISVDANGKVTVKKAYVGKATITITAAATDKYAKTSTSIQIRVNPGAAKITSLKNTGKRQITLKWKASASTKSTGYQIQYATNKKYTGKKTVTVKNIKTVSKKIKGLKKGKTYYVRIRTYLKYGSDTYYSPWNNKKVKIKK